MQIPKYKRDGTKELKARVVQKPRFIQIVIGPRQVGKTTAVKQVIKDLEFPSHYCSADLPAPPDPSWISQAWERARLMENRGRPVILILDEIQKVSRWSEVVKKLWDEDRARGRDLRVVILGSSSLLIRKGLTESLAGRFELLRFSHWTFRECSECFGWNSEKYLYFGGYPGAASLIQDEPRWSSYIRDSLIETAISKDVLLLNPIEKPALLRKLFMLACEYGGQVVSYQKLVGQLADAGNTTTLAHYQHLLESAYLIAGLEKYSGSKIRKRSSSPKWLPLNTALITAISQKGFVETRSDPVEWGRLTECAAGAYLFNEAGRWGLELFYWREGNYEVDYLLKKGRRVIAIEIKSGRKRTVLNGLKEFQKRYKTDRSLVIGPSDMPLEEFLSKDIRLLFP
jgi:predicted AAA+ superfamily ATPase